MAGNKNLHDANRAKKDEFYTQLGDIANEMRHYKEHFRDKTILCNCDDPYESNFFKYFALNFNALGLKKLIATCYAGSPIADKQLSIFDDEKKTSEQSKTRVPHKIIITEVHDLNNDGAVDLLDVEILLKDDKNVLTRLEGNGDFRSAECVELLNEADIVVTNPPFSLFREYVAQLIQYEKKFLIIGSQNAITYKEIFKLIKENKIWLGFGFQAGNAFFAIPKYENNYADGVYNAETGLVKFRNCHWFTNLDHSKRHEDLDLFKRYTPEEYPKYDNYDAINVDKTADIPMNYTGVMGVPITFLDKYNPEQFEILDPRDFTTIERLKNKNYALIKDADGSINGKAKYARILIRNIKI
ncbi:MAG: adenine-specific methyltransferase EcoRI family protein [Bacteroidales bacterium]|nr:adenine-specific methyltransferase EcoRI family protein [Bacteroidales bacterium]